MTRINREQGWRPLGQLCWNTRIGLNFTPDTWAWVRKHLPLVHVLYLQEVKDVARVERILGDDWIVWPDHRGLQGTVCLVAIRKRRFVLEDTVRRQIKSAKHQREIIALVVTDKRTSRKLVLGSLHVDPLGKGFVEANAIARVRHINQVEAWADFAKGWIGWSDDAAVFIGGDVNERLQDEHTVARRKPALADKTVLAQFRQVDLTSAAVARGQLHLATMLDIWHGGRGVKCVDRQEYQIPGAIDGAEHLDHALVYTWYGVKGDE